MACTTARMIAAGSTGWAGPWPVLRHDAPDGVPRWRFQVVDEHGCGWLLVREADGWWIL